MLTFLLYSLRLLCKLHSIMEKKKIENIATDPLQKYYQNQIHFYLFFCSLITTQQFKIFFNFEMVWHRKSLMLSRFLCWFADVYYFLHLLKIALFIYILSFCIFQNDWTSLWIMLFCIFCFRIFYFFRKGVWVCKTYTATTLATIHGCVRHIQQQH